MFARNFYDFVKQLVHPLLPGPGAFYVPGISGFDKADRSCFRYYYLLLQQNQ